MKWWRITLVIFGALIVTALGIDAADTISGKEGTLLSRVIETQEGRCPSGMVEVSAVPGITCVDQYEISTSEGCPIENPQSLVESQKNVDTRDCSGQPNEGKEPWGYVTREQALQVCSRDGKRLPTAAEWYALTIGMIDVEKVCNIDSKKRSPSGAYAECKTGYGAHDLVGNLWEWVSDDVIEGKINGRTLPENGYVAQVDSGGIAITTHTEEQELFGNDYFWAPSEGAFGMIRGGYYDSGTDGGVYAVHADTMTNAASAGIGFRCVI